MVDAADDVMRVGANKPAVSNFSQCFMQGVSVFQCLINGHKFCIDFSLLLFAAKVS